MKKYYEHPHAIVETKNIGLNTRINAFSHVLSGAVIGAECTLFDHTFVQNDVLIGDRVTIHGGVQLWDGITLEDDVFIGPNATFTNDPFPRSKHYPDSFTRTIIRKAASIGANATILPGITIGQHAMVGAGTVVTKDVPPFAIVVGNPARIVGYVQTSRGDSIRPEASDTSKIISGSLNVKGVYLYDLPVIVDLRGSLTFAEIEDSLPFVPKRFFLLFDVPSKDVRGEHAHRECHQFLVCTKGSCSVVVDDGEYRLEILLDRPNKGLHIPPMVWATEYKFSQDAVLLVLASDLYDSEDYIRDYDRFLAEAQKK